jgi:uncharacterized protein
MKPPDPRTPAPLPPRYSHLPLPAYRFLPGSAPHPRRDPRGHSYGLPEPRCAPLDPGAWASSELYLHAVDLYNHAYWWECHEALEALWRAAGRGTEQGIFLQGLIQIAASQLKRRAGAPGAARSLSARGLQRLARAPSPYMGLDVRAFERAVRDQREGLASSPPLLVLSAA